jgi:hypothetical protein
MNIQKLIAIIVAIAINCAVLGWFHSWTTGVASAAAAAASAQSAVMLPVINVRPSAEQLRAVGRLHAGTAAGGQAAVSAGNQSALVMPYYSFAAQPTSRDAG